MSSLVSNVENITPLSENVTPVVASKVETPAQVESTPVVAEVQSNLTSAEDAVEADDVDDESEDPSYVEDSDDDMAEDDEDLVEDEDDEKADQFGEQSEEVVSPMSLEEEARAAAQLAAAYGLNSTDDALSLVGKNFERRMGNIISNYSQQIATEPEVAPFYDEISQKINTLRTQIDATIVQIVNQLSFKINAGGVEILRTQMELFMREVLRHSAVLAEYCSHEFIRTSDILTALQTMGRPMYWDSKESEESSTTDANVSVTEDDGDAMDEDEMEEDEEDSAWEKESRSAAPEVEERDTQFSRESFRACVNVLMPSGLTNESYDVVQAATETYLMPLIEASAKSAKFVGKTEISADEVRFALQMISRQ